MPTTSNTILHCSGEGLANSIRVEKIKIWKRRNNTVFSDMRVTYTWKTGESMIKLTQTIEDFRKEHDIKLLCKKP